MTEARWQQVKAVFLTVVDRPPSEQAALLAAMTDGDDALRSQVESLLRADGEDGNFTGRLPFAGAPSPVRLSGVSSDSGGASPALSSAAAAGETAISDVPAVVGAVDVQREEAAGSLRPYRIIAPLGAGGMGEVFRARDERLNRDVALKVLPHAFELDAERVARFRREAQVLAALNHPHIAGIYGLDESGDRQALVLELVEGVTLADRIAEGPLPLPEALRIARQIADALQTAHAKGIVHRDLKPSNVKVTLAGVVKVLDFGLAKMTAGGQDTAARLSPVVAEGATSAGAIVGTAAYMSPEQARGEEVDARTDTWAFGCVLYEMLTGRKPFGARWIPGPDRPQPDWSALPSSTPAAVLRLLRQCLEPEAAKRLAALADARAVIDQVLAPRRARVSRGVWAALGAAALLVVWQGIQVSMRPERSSPVTASSWVPLTSLDSITQPALSPDGTMLAFIRGPSTFVSPGQVYVKILPDGEPVALTDDALPKMGPVFSPDGTRVVYTVNDGRSWDTWEVPVRGGAPRRWLRNASGLAWIGAGDVLFSEIKRGIHMAVVKATAAATDPRDVYVPPHENGMAHKSYVSPDRRQAIVVEMDANSVWLPCRLVTIDGAQTRVVGPVNARCTSAGWSPDGGWMYFTADAGDGFHLWRQRTAGGGPEQFTFGPTDEEGVAVAPDGRSVVTSVGFAQRSVWVRESSGDRQILLEGYAYFPLLSADGTKICFRVARGMASGMTPSELWVVDLRSGRKHRLFPDRMVTGHDVSRNDRVVAAIDDGSGRSALWISSLDGREPPRRIGAIEGDIPRFGRDGDVLFRGREGAETFLFRVRDDGSGREKIGKISANVLGTVSPDGEWLSAITDQSMLSLLSLSGRAPFHIYPYSQTSRVRWSLDGAQLYFSIQYGQASAFAIGRTYVMPVTPGSVLPALPSGGFRTEEELAAMAGVQVIPYGDVAPGPSPAIYAYSRVTTTRNLYRIPVDGR